MKSLGTVYHRAVQGGEAAPYPGQNQVPDPGPRHGWGAYQDYQV